jgi:hypothetical protein
MFQKIAPLRAKINVKWEMIEGESFPTIQNGRCPMDDCSPKVNPTNKMQIIWCIGLLVDDVIYCPVKNRDWS